MILARTVPLLLLTCLSACSAGGGGATTGRSSATDGEGAIGSTASGDGTAGGATNGDVAVGSGTSATANGGAGAAPVASGITAGATSTGLVNSAGTGAGMAVGSAGSAAATTVGGGDITFEVTPETMVNGCNELEVGFEKRRPTVILLVDTSTSMFEPRADLWDPLHDAVLAVVSDLQDEVDFGFTSYTSVTRGAAPGGVADATACPALATVAAGPNNLASITAAYDAAGVVPTADHKWDTPTGDAIEAVAAELVGLPSEAPKHILLVTDGNPDICGEPDPQCGGERSITALQNAFVNGITTYVVGIGDILGNDEGCRGRCGVLHLQDLANAGLGQPVAPNDPAALNNGNCYPRDAGGNLYFEGTYAATVADAGTAQAYTAANPGELATALGSIIQGVRSCDFAMGKNIEPASANLGTVQLVTDAVPTDFIFGDTNGWSFVAPNIVRLEGTACSSVQQTETGTIDISFPCEAYIR